MSWVGECRVMVVSSNEPFRAAVTEALTEEGCEAEAHAAGPKAIEAAKARPPEVIFVGPVDPETIDFLARLEQELPERRPHVALLVEEQVAEAGQPNALRAFVREWISSGHESGDRPSSTAIPFATPTRSA